MIEASPAARMIIGVDRLDYSKGIPERLEAYERFLAANPEWHGKITYLQITPKSRSEIKEYAEMEAAVNRTAGRINGAYSDANWTPVRYVNRPYSRTALAGLYRAARVGAGDADARRHESGGQGICRRPGPRRSRRADPVALCRRGGGIREALLVNPYDPDAVAAAIARAVAMPLDERRTRNDALMRVLAANDITTWGERFLDTLTAAEDEFNFAAVGEALPLAKRATA